jgi:hypothetical protein
MSSLRNFPFGHAIYIFLLVLQRRYLENYKLRIRKGLAGSGRGMFSTPSRYFFASTEKNSKTAESQAHIRTREIKTLES